MKTEFIITDKLPNKAKFLIVFFAYSPRECIVFWKQNEKYYAYPSTWAMGHSMFKRPSIMIIKDFEKISNAGQEDLAKGEFFFYVRHAFVWFNRYAKHINIATYLNYTFNLDFNIITAQFKPHKGKLFYVVNNIPLDMNISYFFKNLIFYPTRKRIFRKTPKLYLYTHIESVVINLYLPRQYYMTALHTRGVNEYTFIIGTMHEDRREQLVFLLDWISFDGEGMHLALLMKNKQIKYLLDFLFEKPT